MFKIKDFTFTISNHDNIMMPENLNKFICNDDASMYHYDIYVSNDIKVLEDHYIINKDTIKIVSNNGLEKRYLYIKGDIRPYAVCEETDHQHSIVHVHKAYTELMFADTMFVSLLSLERRLHEQHCYALHSAYMIRNNKAILFSAPSGTGKSTQASLWEKYRGTRVINGDKSLLSKDDNIYYANGWPICGSSEICFNERYPILCIVVLSQGKENSIVRLSYKDAFKKILSELTINYHNSKFVNEAMNFIDDLLLHVPVYHLTCDISENAVKCLENKLKEDKLI